MNKTLNGGSAILPEPENTPAKAVAVQALLAKPNKRTTRIRRAVPSDARLLLLHGMKQDRQRSLGSRLICQRNSIARFPIRKYGRRHPAAVKLRCAGGSLAGKELSRVSSSFRSALSLDSRWSAHHRKRAGVATRAPIARIVALFIRRAPLKSVFTPSLHFQCRSARRWRSRDHPVIGSCDNHRLR